MLMLHIDSEKPWWRDQSLVIGVLGKQRPLEILNTLTTHRHRFDVCEEETVGEIAARYARFNSNVLGYKWRFDGVDLKMDLTLTQNNVKDDRDVYLKLNWPE